MYLNNNTIKTMLNSSTTSQYCSVRYIYIYTYLNIHICKQYISYVMVMSSSSSIPLLLPSSLPLPRCYTLHCHVFTAHDHHVCDVTCVHDVTTPRALPNR